MRRRGASALFQAVLATAGITLTASAAASQSFESRGFIEARGFAFPAEASNDSTRLIADVLVRQEAFFEPIHWFTVAAGVDLRANSHDQVENDWALNGDDRGIRRPRLSLRRMSVAFGTGRFGIEGGKQFIRWGLTDIVNPTDRFAPKDYLNVLEPELLPVLAFRPAAQLGSEIFEAVLTPDFTPSRIPLRDQRWTIIPPEAEGFSLNDAGSSYPQRNQYGIRWRHVGAIDFGLSFFDGMNHLPEIEVTVRPKEPVIDLRRSYPRLRTYGGEVSVPTRYFTLKGEAAFFESPTSTSEEYVIYVIEAERQIGEWVLAAGYVGDVVTTTGSGLQFSPERGVARAIMGHASYTVDPRRTVVIEGAIRQDGDGLYVKGEYTVALGQYWRFTITGVGLEGDNADFLGQYRNNSHASAALRLSY